MSRGLDGYYVEYGYVDITTNGSGTGSGGATFTRTFLSAPSVLVVAGKTDAGTRVASSITTTGFTITVTSSGLVSGVLRVYWVAHEKTA